MTSEPPTKKAAVAEHDFVCTIGQPTTCRTMMEMIHGVMDSCTFEVKNTDDFKGIVVEILDDKK